MFINKDAFNGIIFMLLNNHTVFFEFFNLPSKADFHVQRVATLQDFFSVIIDVWGPLTDGCFKGRRRKQIYI